MRPHNITITLLSGLILLMLTPAFAAELPGVPVRLGEVQESAAGQSIRVNGVIQSRHDVQLAATVEGQLQWVLEEGSLVTAGQTVAKVDDANLILQKHEQQVLADRASINVAYLNKEVDRLTELQRASMASDTAIAEMTSRRDLARNDFNTAQSRVAQLDEQLARTEIISPFPGMIVRRLRQAGEFARRGESVIRVVDPQMLEVRINLPLQYLGRVESGTEVTIEVKGSVLQGEIHALLYASEQSSQAIEALVNITSSNEATLVDGQFAEVGIPLSDSSDALFVPRDALVLRGDGNYVFRIDQDNKAVKVNVELLEGQGNMVGVRGQLQAGDRVAIRGVERLTDGQTVLPTPT